VEKAICADPGLAQLDRNINDVFLRAIASAESDSHRAALALTRQQRDFIGKRNASFGRRGYDLRQAMEERLQQLQGKYQTIDANRSAGAAASQRVRLGSVASQLRRDSFHSAGRGLPSRSPKGRRDGSETTVRRVHRG
jgi:uncharacterized protein